jgi:type IV pilus assembly protein PilV
MTQTNRPLSHTRLGVFQSGTRQRGAALLEVLISILLFSFGILGLVGLQARAIGFSLDAENRNRAALLANDIASVMWLNRSVTVPAADLTAWQTRVGTQSAGGLPSGVGTATAVAGTTTSADILITWHAPSRAASEADSQLTTRVTVNLP